MGGLCWAGLCLSHQVGLGVPKLFFWNRRLYDGQNALDLFLTFSPHLWSQIFPLIVSSWTAKICLSWDGGEGV